MCGWSGEVGTFDRASGYVVCIDGDGACLTEGVGFEAFDKDACCRVG